MSGRFQPDNGADSAQSLADAIATVEAAGFTVKLDPEIEAVIVDGAWNHVNGIIPACIACSERAEPTSVWCRYHRLRVEEEAAL
jgi:hypothetical protein